jgi:PilZ domain
MERRRHKRIDTFILVKIHVQLSESPEAFWINCGVLENISYEGAYFRSNDKPPLEQGQIRDFIITPTKEHPDFPGITFIDGTGQVVRIDPPKTGCNGIGVALEFISAKVFEFLIKIN